MERRLKIAFRQQLNQSKESLIYWSKSLRVYLLRIETSLYNLNFNFQNFNKIAAKLRILLVHLSLKYQTYSTQNYYLYKDSLTLKVKGYEII